MPTRTAAGFLAAVSAIVLAVVVHLAVVADRDEKAARVTERSETVLALQRLENALARAEGAQRNYLLTPEERHLEAYRRAIAEITPALDAVSARTAALPLSGPKSEALATLVNAKVAELRHGIRVREADGLAKTLKDLRAGDAAWLSAAIETLRADMESDERAALGAQQRAWFGRVALADALFLAANAALLALVVVAGFAARADLRRREAQAEERKRLLELQQGILGIVSHDLRNPLSAIQSGAVLLARAPLAPAQARVAAIITSSARRMEGIIRDLLDYTRLRAKGGIPLSVRATDVGEICSRVADETALTARERTVEVRCEGDLSGEWDPDRLQQAIGNLVSNALHHSPAGAPVRVRAVGEAAEVRVEVENDGPPIPSSLTRSLFEPFQGAGEPTGALGGLGLGLYIVRSIVEAHAGAVEVASDPSRPVTFTIRLPRVRPGPRRGRVSGVWRPTRAAASRGGDAAQP